MERQTLLFDESPADPIEEQHSLEDKIEDWFTEAGRHQANKRIGIPMASESIRARADDRPPQTQQSNWPASKPANQRSRRTLRRSALTPNRGLQRSTESRRGRKPPALVFAIYCQAAQVHQLNVSPSSSLSRMSKSIELAVAIHWHREVQGTVSATNEAYRFDLLRCCCTGRAATER